MLRCSSHLWLTSSFKPLVSLFAWLRISWETNTELGIFNITWWRCPYSSVLICVCVCVCPHIHPQHSLFNGSWRGEHLFIHHVSQLLCQHISPFRTQILNMNHTVTAHVTENWAKAFVTGKRNVSNLSQSEDALDGVAHRGRIGSL